MLGVGCMLVMCDDSTPMYTHIAPRRTQIAPHRTQIPPRRTPTAPPPPWNGVVADDDGGLCGRGARGRGITSTSRVSKTTVLSILASTTWKDKS